jgi:outer membrane immunogenic protein
MLAFGGFVMRAGFIAISAALGLLSSAALAADLPNTKEPPAFAPPPPAFSWTGLYVGVNGGYHWGGSSSQFSSTDTSGGGLGAAQALGLIPYSGPGGASGAIAGGTLGYNWQFSSFVLGVEGDIDGATGRRGISTARSTPFFDETFFNTSQQLDWLGTVRGRVGFTPIDRLLIYGTGGLAFGESTTSFSVYGPAYVPPLADSISNSTHFGWTIGGGVEYAIDPHWSVKAEYLYYDLGRTTGTVFYTYGPTSSLTGSQRQNGDIVRLGVNYKFDMFGPPAPVVAKY